VAIFCNPKKMLINSLTNNQLTIAEYKQCDYHSIIFDMENEILIFHVETATLNKVSEVC